MSGTPNDGWMPAMIANDQQMIDLDDDAPPQGKKWECCSACQGKGKILVDDEDVASIQRPNSVPLSAGGSDGVKGNPTEERRRGNNPFGPRGTLRCLACQKRKKKCEFESLDSACLRCQARSLECGPKLPPQQRPRSITSVPADYRRPVSLNVDTRLFANLPDDFDTPASASSPSSAMHSLPVSPFIFPVRSHFESLDAAITPLQGSPAASALDTFESPPLGMNLNMTTDEIQPFQNAYIVHSAPVMSHQTSQQTITPQAPMFESTSTIQYHPAFDSKDEEIETKTAANLLNLSFPHTQPVIPSSQHAYGTLNHPQPVSAPSAWEPCSSAQEMYPNSVPLSLHHNLSSSSISHPPPHCALCGTVQTPHWRKNQMGDLICEKCGIENHIANVPPQPLSKRQTDGRGTRYWNGKFSRMEAPSFNSVMSDETNGTGSSTQPNPSQDSEEMLLFEMQI